MAMRRIFLGLFLVMGCCGSAFQISEQPGASNGDKLMTGQVRPTPPALIINSGSTNTPGYQITLYESGRAEYMRWPRRIPEPGTPAPVITTRVVPGDLASGFFRDLRAALPFSQYEDKGCAKSASFGFSLHVKYKDEQSPDLECPVSDPRLHALVKDVYAVEQAVSAGIELKTTHGT
jgi:hypothetical protein